LVEVLRRVSRFKLIEAVFVVDGSSSIVEALERVTERGARRVVLIPISTTAEDVILKCSLYGPNKDLERRATKLSGVEVVYGDPLDLDISIAKVVEERALIVLGRACRPQGLCCTEEVSNAGPVFEESLNIVRGMLKEVLKEVPIGHAKIIERVVHATADLDLVRLIVISDGALEAGVRAIKSGANVVADVKMVAVGIDAARVSKFGGRVVCYMEDARASKLASEAGLTKTAAAMRLAIIDGVVNGAVVVIGNSPTATFELVRAVESGEVRPALIIATPVGFVNSAEAKEAVMRLDVPFITVRGFKGGSPVAVAVFNALLTLAEESS